MTDLAGAVAGLPPDNSIRTAKVVRAQPLVLSVQGGIVDDAGSIARVNVGDTVACVRQGQTWLVLGVIQPASVNIGYAPIARGVVSASVGSSGTSVVTVHNGLWSAPTAPALVMTQMVAKPGGSANWWVAGLNPTATGFTSAAYGPAPGVAMTLLFGYIAVW
jgi:hypothetical protein